MSLLIEELTRDRMRRTQRDAEQGRAAQRRRVHLRRARRIGENSRRRPKI